jgi:hypothetical protein
LNEFSKKNGLDIPFFENPKIRGLAGGKRRLVGEKVAASIWIYERSLELPRSD